MKHTKIVNAGSDNGKRVLLSEQRVELAGVMNARELGGYENTDKRKIKRGCLIRSGHLNAATSWDKRLIYEQFRVGTVIDFRTPREAAEKPDPPISVSYYNLPVLESTEELGTAGLYLKMLFDDIAKKAYKRFFELLLASDSKQSVLFHSDRGNDRTGIAAALLLTALGVSEDTVTEDYLLSNKAYERAELTDLPIIPAVHAYSLDYAFTTAKVEYGSVTNYINKELGLSNKDIGELKRKYLV